MRRVKRLLLLLVGLTVIVPSTEAWAKKPDYRYKVPKYKYKKPKIKKQKVGHHAVPHHAKVHH